MSDILSQTISAVLFVRERLQTIRAAKKLCVLLAEDLDGCDRTLKIIHKYREDSKIVALKDELQRSIASLHNVIEEAKRFVGKVENMGKFAWFIKGSSVREELSELSELLFKRHTNLHNCFSTVTTASQYTAPPPKAIVVAAFVKAEEEEHLDTLKTLPEQERKTWEALLKVRSMQTSLMAMKLCGEYTELLWDCQNAILNYEGALIKALPDEKEQKAIDDKIKKLESKLDEAEKQHKSMVSKAAAAEREVSRQEQIRADARKRYENLEEHATVLKAFDTGVVLAEQTLTKFNHAVDAWRKEITRLRLEVEKEKATAGMLPPSKQAELDELKEKAVSLWKQAQLQAAIFQKKFPDVQIHEVHEELDARRQIIHVYREKLKIVVDRVKGRLDQVYQTQLPMIIKEMSDHGREQTVADLKKQFSGTGQLAPPGPDKKNNDIILTAIALVHAEVVHISSMHNLHLATSMEPLLPGSESKTNTEGYNANPEDITLPPGVGPLPPMKKGPAEDKNGLGTTNRSNRDEERKRAEQKSNQDAMDELQRELDFMRSQLNRAQTEKKHEVAELKNQLAKANERVFLQDYRKQLSDLRALNLARPVAGGQYADVFKAEMEGKTVAVKRLKIKKIEDVGTLINELDTLAHCGCHDHIVEFKGYVITQDGKIFFLCSWAEGGCLENILDAQGTDEFKLLRSKEGLLRVCHDVLAGLGHLHSKRVIHRDIAARNVLINEQGKYMLTDFGLARRSGKGPYIMRTEAMTPAWFEAPETWNHGVYTAETDMWSFACFMWEILTDCGDRVDPFEGKVSEEFVEVKEGKVTPQLPKNELPPSVQEMIKKCWSYNPKDRPTAAQLLDECRKHMPNRDQQPQDGPVVFHE